MIRLSGINLGQRQYELNKKVYELYIKKESFEQISATKEKSDVDRLLKIDIANLHQNVKYLVETLKCGDPVYISRALKCNRLFEDAYIINPDYVHRNIFPFMSQKMKRKMLTAIAMHVKDQEKIESFYQYCIRHKQHAIAYKFLIKSSKHFKEEYIKSVADIDDSIKFEFFFGNSTDLINQYIQKKKLNNLYLGKDLLKFRYLFSNSPENYLDMLEDCLEKEKCAYYNNFEFGLRISKAVMTNHKQRVFDKPWLYLGVLEKSMITRHTSSDDAKKYAVALLPKKCEDFWSMNFYSTYAFFLKKIPAKEFYAFLKEIFIAMYPNEAFEMNFSFYRHKYYKFMTPEERHEWALQHIEQKREHFGALKDYKWYEFVKFNKAFFEIKKLIYINKSADIRSDLMEVLVKSASQADVETLLSYYYERHVNESRLLKERFMDQIIETHNLYKLDEKCWNIVMKLFHSLEAFTPNSNSNYSFHAVLYNIIHYNRVSEDLETYCAFGRSFPIREILEKLDSEQCELVYNYLKQYFAEQIKKLIANPSDPENLLKKEVKNETIKLIWSSVALIDTFKKPDDDLPEIVMRGVKLYWEEFSYYRRFNPRKKDLTAGDLLRLLKTDKNLFLEKFPTEERYKIKCTTLLKKIKIYFNDDVAKSMIDFYNKKMLKFYADKEKYNLNFKTILFNLLQLSDISFKIKLMTEYAPTSAKIVHGEIDKNLLKIQKAICRFMYTSRPPVPLSIVKLYLKGDYVPFCLPIFNSYLAHLPLPAFLELIETLLDSPISIQKHGLRLAFDSYEIDNLKELITKVWNKTQNGSLRLVIFKAVINKIGQVSESDQIKLYEALKKFTLSLRVDDSEEIYDLLASSRLPENLFSDFLGDAWTLVNRLPFNSKAYIDRKSEIIDRIERYSRLGAIDRNICDDIIEDHINTMFVNKQILGYDNSYNIRSLYDYKWKLVVTYITSYSDVKELVVSLELLQKVMNACFNMWNEIKVVQEEPVFIVRKHLKNTLASIKQNVYYRHEREQKPLDNAVLQSIVDFFERYLPDDFLTAIDFKLAIMFRNIVGNAKYDEDTQKTSYKHLRHKAVAKSMSRGIIHLLSKQFYPSLLVKIADKIFENIEGIESYTELNLDQLIMIISRHLSEQPEHDLRLLALHLVPLDGYKDYPDEFNAIASNIKSSNDYDLNSFLYHSFIWCDSVNRVPT